MAANSNSETKLENWKVSGISNKYPTYRQHLLITKSGWLAGKRADDEAEGYWRIDDNLYDFSDFVQRHPGGKFWLEQTKGTDITEPFESHHILLEPNELLAKYKVRAAKKPRNYKFTLKENGFYMTLKRRVRDKLISLNYKPSRKTDFLHSSILSALLLLSLLTVLNDSVFFKLLAGLAMSWLGTAAHNYFHQKDNWRMYTFNFTLMNCNSWRISHALSHHIYANSLHDLEMSLFEPFLCYVPSHHYGPKLQRIISVIISPIVYTFITPYEFLSSVYSILCKNVMYWHDLIGFILPLFMWLFSDAPLLTVLVNWITIILIGSFLFGLIGLTAAHHDPRIYHDGDAVRSDLDWGLYQLDSIIDRVDIKGNNLLVLTHFGEHALHHMFPTLDHGVLHKLYPEFLQTLREFKVELCEMSHFNHIVGANLQLLRTKPNKNAPDSKEN